MVLEGWLSSASLNGQETTHWTPPGWRAVLLTLLGAMVVVMRRKEEEWKLERCCFDTCCLAKSWARGAGELDLGGGSWFSLNAWTIGPRTRRGSEDGLSNRLVAMVLIGGIVKACDPRTEWPGLFRGDKGETSKQHSSREESRKGRG